MPRPKAVPPRVVPAPISCPLCGAALVAVTRVVKGTYPASGTVRTFRKTQHVCKACDLAVVLHRIDRPTTGSRRNADRFEIEWARRYSIRSR